MFLWKFFGKLFSLFLILTVSIPVIIVMGPILIIQAVCSGSKGPIQSSAKKPPPKRKEKVESKPVSNKKQKKTRKTSDLKWIDDLEDLHAALDD